MNPQIQDIKLKTGDALVIVDVQLDFLPGGQLAVTHGDEVIAPLIQYMTLFQQHGLPILATRDWHPPDHCSFKSQGGPWPPHCIAGTPGAQFTPDLTFPCSVTIISKATRKDADAYSGFEGTALTEILRREKIRRLFIGGLATDYCVLNTVRDGLRLGFQVFLLEDAIRAVNIQPGDGARAIAVMQNEGARPICRNFLS